MKQIIFSLLFIAFVSCGYAEETIKITTEVWEPYVSKSMKYHGLACRIVTEAFALEGVKVKYGFFTWARGYLLAKEGDWNGTFPYYFKNERTKFFIYSDPIFDGAVVFFHLKSYSFNWKTYEDLKNIAIGTTLGYTYGKEFDEAKNSGIIKTQKIAKNETNFEKMLLGRIQIFPFSTEVGYYTLQKLFPPEQAQLFTHHSKPLHTSPLYLILSKKNDRNKHLLLLFNKGLKRLKESGKYDEYFAEFR